jgi:hypothetical protein
MELIGEERGKAVFTPIRKAAERQIIVFFRHAKSSSLPNGWVMPEGLQKCLPTEASSQLHP